MGEVYSGVAITVLIVLGIVAVGGYKLYKTKPKVSRSAQKRKKRNRR